MPDANGRHNLVLPPAIEDAGRAVIGCAIEVQRHLGPGLPEKLYEDALVHELKLALLSAEQQVELAVPYKGILLRGQRLDLVVSGSVIVELKALAELHPVHAAQLLSYLRAADLPLGYLFNFNSLILKDAMKRICNDRWPPFSRVSPL